MWKNSPKRLFKWPWNFKKSLICLFINLHSAKFEQIRPNESKVMKGEVAIYYFGAALCCVLYLFHVLLFYVPNFKFAARNVALCIPHRVLSISLCILIPGVHSCRGHSSRLSRNCEWDEVCMNVDIHILVRELRDRYNSQKSQDSREFQKLELNFIHPYFSLNFKPQSIFKNWTRM